MLESAEGMAKDFPIKEVATIQLIKRYYEEQKDFRNLLFFLLAINTGLKINEILNLNVEDVKNKKYITVKQCDAGVKKKIPLNKEIQELIKFVIKDLDLKSPLFVSIRGKRMERTAVYTQFKNVCRSLDLSNISIASLRKTFGYHYYQKYKDLSFLQWLFNQSTVIATMKYIGVHENLSSRFNLEFSL